MTDREKVIKGLECHISKKCAIGSYTCPYWENDDCTNSVMVDALELLKARVLTPEEIKAYDGYCWGEQKDEKIMYVCLIKDGLLSMVSDYEDPPYDVEKLCWPDYGKVWRYWSAQPTDEQRKTVKWDG